MDLDEKIALSFKGIPVLRIYGWNPYCISLGYNQNIEDIDEEYCKDRGIDIARRPTGGRAILHSEELTYSVIMESGGKSIMEVYKYLSFALLRGIKELGANVDFSKTQPDFQNLYKDKSSIPCFSSSAKYEIEFGGKKLVGSAQRRYDNIVLQHGSILIDEYHTNLPKFLSKKVTPEMKKRIEDDIISKTITLNKILNKKLAFEEVGTAIKKGFELEYDIKFKDIGVEEL
jgi:lipoyl(octanoyl) transferase